MVKSGAFIILQQIFWRSTQQLRINTDLIIRNKAGAGFQFNNGGLRDEVISSQLCHDGQLFLRDVLFLAELADAQTADIFPLFVVPKGFQGVHSCHGNNRDA